MKLFFINFPLLFVQDLFRSFIYFAKSIRIIIIENIKLNRKWKKVVEVHNNSNLSRESSPKLNIK